MTELEIIKKVQAGDDEAFKELVEIHQAKVYHLLLGLVHDIHASQELTQETFIKAWKNIKTFKFKSSFWTWLYRIAYNIAIDYTRANRKYFLVELDEKLVNLSEFNEPLENLLKQDRDRDLIKAMQELSLPQKTAIILYYFQGLSYQEIAEITSRRISSIRTDLHRGKEKLREIISVKWR